MKLHKPIESVECSMYRAEENDAYYLFYDDSTCAYILSHYSRDDSGMLNLVSSGRVWDVNSAVSGCIGE